MNVSKYFTSRKRDRHRGQGMTEYIVIVALIAVAAIGVYKFFGQTVRQQTAAMAMELSGQSGANAVTGAQTAAGDAVTQAQPKHLGTYTGNN